MLPSHTAVRITDPHHEMWGVTGFVFRREGETFREDGVVPGGHLVVAYDPHHLGYFRSELVHEDEVEIVGC
ncbi:hypothetical protein JMJ58_19540 [Haloterrigena salifodinae]|uniref:Uncharacterized protein n=1 Tax=Haloterrigena salifodinae TaxID=2675099 RepID=A0A8T8DZW5_9EURY|nr:hypothetical protein [Haloterrigena salifodinae]QRV15075.1 hypothetical protein JMJ58_19540 [Haloterrigena salifodinae]